MKVLICPLNWGLGHATRCVPIIRKLMVEGHEPVLVADGYPLQFLRQEFPSLRSIEFPSYSVYYASGTSQVGAMLLNLPGIILGIIDEHSRLRNLLKTEHFDQIISDNRFGMWNKRVHSIYITHQLMIKMPQGLRFLEPLAHFIHKTFIHQYDECWIPDTKENGGLSGDLAHNYPLPRNARFIGTLSRFQGMENTTPATDYEIVAIVSGIEPQRTLFEEHLMLKYRNRTEKVLILGGQPQKKDTKKQTGNITLVSHLSTHELAAAFLGAKKIISRSGYSTIMDLETLKCLQKAEFTPTPGQTEQEYLSSIHC
jgi:predicted glycosyltransferase